MNISIKNFHYIYFMYDEYKKVLSTKEFFFFNIP